jgi:hypothetical protein
VSRSKTYDVLRELSKTIEFRLDCQPLFWFFLKSFQPQPGQHHSHSAISKNIVTTAKQPRSTQPLNFPTSPAVAWVWIAGRPVGSKPNQTLGLRSVIPQLHSTLPGASSNRSRGAKLAYFSTSVPCISLLCKQGIKCDLFRVAAYSPPGTRPAKKLVNNSPFPVESPLFVRITRRHSYNLLTKTLMSPPSRRSDSAS